MSHVDDGSLHAYLDGALDALPASESARIREHLSSCDACARRLEEERALRAEAQAILAGADPGPGEVPPLEELRARAVARRHPRAAVHLRNLTWAASIVLAVGAGWMLRGSQSWRFSEALGPGGAPEARASAGGTAESGPAKARAEDAATTPEGRAAQDRATEAGAAQAAAGAGGQAPAGDRPVDVRPQTGREEEVAAPPAVPVVEPEARAAPPPERLREAQPREEALRRTLEAGRAVVAGVLADTSLAAERFQAAQIRPVSAQAKAADLAAPSPSLSVTTAEQPLFRSLPGARVLSVTPAEEGFPAGAVRVLQLIEGDTLEVVRLPDGAARPDVAELLPDGRTQVVVERAGRWVVGRARMPREALEALLARLDTGR